MKITGGYCTGFRSLDKFFATDEAVNGDQKEAREYDDPINLFDVRQHVVAHQAGDNLHPPAGHNHKGSGRSPF
jgi:hypothetical protein